MLLQRLEKPDSSVFLFQQKKLRYGRDLKELPPAGIWDTLESRIQSEGMMEVSGICVPTHCSGPSLSYSCVGLKVSIAFSNIYIYLKQNKTTTFSL